MKVIKEKTTLVQTTELRSNLPEVLKRARTSRVVLERHHKPVAVLIDPDEYERIEEALEQFSDLLLALEARSREPRGRRNEYVDLEQVLKRFL